MPSDTAEILIEPSVEARKPLTTRRLSDKLLTASHQACDQGDLEVSSQLLDVLDMITARPLFILGDRRKDVEGLVAAHQRLWFLRRR